MFKLDSSDCAAARSAAMLDRIARALDCSVAAFSDPASSEQAETVELLRLWLTITDERDRAKVLAFVRSAAPNKGI